MTNCKSCEAVLNGPYCSQCGISSELKRIDGHFIFQEFRSVFNFEKGIFFTIRELLIRPGKTVQSFIIEDRNRLIKPLVFIIICSLFYSLINQFFLIEDKYLSYQNSNATATKEIFKWIQANYGYSNILMGIFIAFWIKIFFKRYKYNFFEMLILICFVMAIGMLILSLFALIEGVSKKPIMFISGILSFVYSIWAIGQFFDSKKITSYFKALGAYFIGSLSFLVFAIIIGTFVDLIV